MKPDFVQFQTTDGLTLPGLLYEATGTKKAAIFLHGNGTTCVFYKTKTAVYEALAAIGYASLVFNNRGAHVLHSHKIVRGDEVERIPGGMAHEVIAACVKDIDGAIAFLKSQGYTEFVLIGSSTGANKICVYDHYKPTNEVSTYVLTAGADDVGVYYQILGAERFEQTLAAAKQLVKDGKGDTLLKDLVDIGEIFSARAFADIADPDGDYNCFPFIDHDQKLGLSKRLPLFDYFSHIKKPSIVIYGGEDEYCGEGGGVKAARVLKELQPTFAYEVVEGADHGFTGRDEDLAMAITKHLA